jgi:heme-degrading monooxygenase HmoA
VILESAVLDVRPGWARSFEAAFAEACALIRATPGFISLELLDCLERDDRYLLLVRWETLEAHTEAFRGSARYERWRELLHGYYDPFPEVLHHRTVVSVGSEADDLRSR